MDENHHQVVQAIERLGYWWWDTSQYSIGVDGFAVGHGRLVPIEIKPPERLILTPYEQQIHLRLRSCGITVEIVTDTGASLEPLRLPRRNSYAPRL